MTATTVQVTEKPFYKSFKTLVGTTNHKEIGILYIVFAFINFFLAGLMAMIIRIELAFPGATIVDSETYSAIFTAHGTAMIFLVILPLGAGFGNYLVPTLIGAKDMYWPRWNNVAFWLLVPAALLVYIGESTVGWTAYTPLSNNDFGNSVDFWILGFAVVGVSSLISGINFIATISAMRKPGLGWFKLDLFSWATLGASLIQLFATPIITVGLVMLLLDRIIDTTFFSAVGAGGGILWQHVFWSYSHPAVYIMILPSMGLTSILIERFAGNKIFGYKSMIISILAIVFMGFLVWAHHMYTSFGISGESVLNYFFNFLTFLIAVPSGIKTFNWILTMWGGKIKWKAPFLFPLGFIIGFLIGGITGIFLNLIPFDIVTHDTYFVVGHFHLIVIGGAVSTLFGASYYLFPKMTGKMYSQKAALLQWLAWVPGFNLTFNSMLILGLLGMPRRYFDYSNFGNVDILTLWNQLATIGAFLQAIAFAIFVFNIIYGLWKGKPAGDDPFGIGEWDRLEPPADLVGNQDTVIEMEPLG